MKLKRSGSKMIVHEHSGDGRHRIVTLSIDGTNEPGEWADARKLAQHGKLLANAEPDNGLPLGVFTVSEQSHQVLGA